MPEHARPEHTGPEHSASGRPDAAGPGGTPSGPAVPTRSAIAAQHPLTAAGVRLTGGLLHDWQRRNATASMPLALHQLVVAGNLDNLQLAVRAAATPATLASPEAAESLAPRAEAFDVGGEPGTGPGQYAVPPAGRAAGVTPSPALGYHGPVFMDSDIYKTLEAIGWELGSEKTGAFGAFAATTIELLARVQRPDGYLNSYVQASGEPRYQNLAASHEMYCDGHFFQAAVALARAAREPGAMDIAIRLADHLVKEFAGQSRALDGHPIVETALVELYRVTGTAAYRDLAAQFVEQRGRGLAGDSGFGRRYLQDHLPVRERTTEVGHAVRALYLEAGVTDVATETNDTELLNGSVARWDDMVATKTSLTGGNGSRHEGESFGDHFELPPDRAYNETCAAIASFQWSWRLLLATGDAKYADHMERILYNGFAAAISTDGMRFFYVNPLQRRVDHYEKDDPGRRREWFKCACCPPNIMRLLASLHHYLATSSGDALTVHQYATAAIAGADLKAELDTGYPWDGAVRLRVTAAPRGTREIALRIPAWSAAEGVMVGDQDHSSERLPVPPDRYLRLRRAWRAGDEVHLRLDMTPRLTRPDPRVDALRGCVAVERGPLVYCFEQTDQPARLDELSMLETDPVLANPVLANPGLAEQAVTLPGIGATIQVTALGASARERPVTLTAIPYFQWDNRGPGAMRVWIPAAPA